MAEERVQRRLAAILAADVVGYSRLVRADEEGIFAELKLLRKDLFDPKIAESSGRIVKLMGDGMLIEFPSVVAAMRTAVDLQRALAERNSGQPPDRRIEFRMGVNLGDVIIDGNDIQGDGVNVASRLEGLAQPGGICIAGAVYEQVRDRLDLTFEDFGEQPLKNIDRPVRIWRWVDVLTAGIRAASASGSRPKTPSIAVLPFDNMSGDPEQEYFSDGIAEDLITALSRIRQFKVIARNSTFSYKGVSPDVRQVSKDLGATYVVEGSVRRAGNRVRVSAQLIDGVTGNHVWAERYDRDLEDIFDVQDELTLTLVGAIEPEMNRSEQRRAIANRSDNLDAWDLYQRGMWHVSRRTPVDISTAKGLFQEAMKLDEGFAPAFAAYAEYVARGVLYGAEQIEREEAEASARHALALDSSDPKAHIALGVLQMFDRNHKQAIAEFEEAIRINPSSAAAYHYLGTSLVHIGRAEEALSYLTEAIRLSPADIDASLFHSRIGLAHYFLGHYEETVRWTEKAIRLPGNNWPMRTFRLAALAQLERHKEVSDALSELLKFRPGISQSYVRDRLPTTDKEYLESLFEGLRKAGLPE